jgi:cytochrome aa3-600 menaquinol oxidase subunit 4
VSTSPRHPDPAAEVPEEYEASLSFLNPRFGEERFPWPQVVGYGLSLILTFAALLLVVNHLMAPVELFALVLVLAAGQAGLQLGVFMHLRESRGTAWQVLPLFLALAIALGMVITSIWIMAFKWGVS